MADPIETVARCGLAAWASESHELWETPTVLGIVGELQLIEIVAGNRGRVVADLVDRHDLHEPKLLVELAFFGEEGGFFASPIPYLELWPKSAAELPAEVFVDDRYKAAFTYEADGVIVTVRHPLRPSAPPRRRLRFRSGAYEAAMIELAMESRRLCDDLIAHAQRSAPEKVESIRSALDLRGRRVV